MIATTPHLIILMETDTGNPIPTEELRFGLRVTVFLLRAPEILLTEAALKIVGPKAFGYDLPVVMK